MQVVVVTSSETLEQVRNAVQTFKEYDWAAPYEIELYDFDAFERNATYDKLAKKDNWLFEYDRGKRGVNTNYWSFRLEDICFIFADPFISSEWQLCGLVHEIGHMTTYRDEIPKLVGKELKPHVSWLRRILEAKADREQLFTRAVHLVYFPTEVIVDR